MDLHRLKDRIAGDGKNYWIRLPSAPTATPTIYAFSVHDPGHAGLLKVGYTDGDAKTRIAQQFPRGLDH